MPSEIKEITRLYKSCKNFIFFLPSSCDFPQTAAHGERQINFASFKSSYLPSLHAYISPSRRLYAGPGPKADFPKQQSIVHSTSRRRKFQHIYFFKCQGQRRFERGRGTCPAPGLTTTAPRCPGPRPRSGPGRRTRGSPGRSRSYATSYTVGCTQTISRKKNKWRGSLRKFFMLDTRGVKVCYSTSFYLRSRKKNPPLSFCRTAKNLSPS